jgi:hypothetical protein
MQINDNNVSIFDAINEILLSWNPILLKDPLDDEYTDIIPIIINSDQSVYTLQKILKNYIIDTLGLCDDETNPKLVKDVEEVSQKIFNILKQYQ